VRFDDTRDALERYRDDERFEELSSRLLSQDEPRIRPLGGRGDRARDAVGGLYRLGKGEELVAMYSLRKDWDTKIDEELRRIDEFGWQPEHVIAVTNRALDRDKEKALQTKAAAKGWALTIHGQDWLANKLHLRDNLNLRTEYLGLARPEPDLFMPADDFRGLLEERGLVPVGFVARERELQAALGRLEPATATVVVEADGGVGKTRLVYEMSKRDRSERRWFFVPEGLPFQPSRLSELESGDEIVVVIDDAHRRTDLHALLAGLERRVPRPQLVLIARPGYDDVVERAQRRLAFDSPEKIRLSPLGRRDVVTLLRQPPFELQREGTLLSIVQLSGGNPQIAIILGKLAASGKTPHDLGDGNVFREYVDSLLDAAPATAPEARELLAVITAVRTIDLTSRRDVATVIGIIGLDITGIRRRLVALADAGLVVEQSNGTFAIKPDLLSEQILRYSFFDENRRPTLPYTTIYESFAPGRRFDLLEALSEARIGSAPAAEDALRMVRGDLLAEIRTSSLESLSNYARFAKATAGIPEISLDVTDAVSARLPELGGSEFDSVANELVSAVARAKLGDFPRGFRTLLHLGLIVFADRENETAAQEALRKDISDVYNSCPVDYSDDDWRILAGVQTVVCDEVEKFWQAHEASETGLVTAAIASRALLTLVYEHHRQAAEDAMSIRMYGVGVPATPVTRAALELGARLFRENFLRLPAKLQLKQLESLREIANVAAGNSGLFGYQPGANEQALAEEVLSDAIEPWLRENVAAMPLPVAAEVLNYFHWRARRGQPVNLRVGARLREYIDLIHPGSRMKPRQSWEEEQKAALRHAEKYATRLLAASDPLKVIHRWNDWLEEAELALEKPTWHQTLPLALAEVGKRDVRRGREIASYIYEGNLRISAYAAWLLETIVAVPAERNLIAAWVERPEPHLRRAAALAAATLDEDDSQPALTRLAEDEDSAVRAAVWDALYRLRGRLSEWQLDIALALSSEASTHNRLDLLLGRLEFEGKQSDEAIVLTDSHKATITELILATAEAERVPHHGIGGLLEHASTLGLELVGEWVSRRIEYLRRHGGRGVYLGDLPDELGPMMRARRDTLGSKDGLVRLFALYEDDDLPWLARHAAEQAIDWLAGDTSVLTAQMMKWSSQGEEGLSRATTLLARTRGWDLFTERARLLLRAHPHDPRLHATIIDARRPMEFMGSREPYYRAEAEQFGKWLEADDPLLVAIGREAIDQYTKLADEAAIDDEREHQGFGA
jgi:hypothetical protein